ncbi:MAG TPA: hypothetical protein VIK11_00450 [Tepidiformaceae bacterium]
MSIGSFVFAMRAAGALPSAGIAVFGIFGAVIGLTTLFYSAIDGRLRRDEAIRRALKELPSDEEMKRERDEEAELLADEGVRSQTLRRLQDEKAQAERKAMKPPPDRWD